MRWRGLRKRLLDNVSEDIRPRIDMQASSCRCPSCKGQGIGSLIWKVDGKDAANFCDLAWENSQGYTPKSERLNPFYETANLEYGQIKREDAFADCWSFLHDLPIQDALLSDSPVIQSLAVMDSRTGKRTLRGLDPDRLHPLARRFLLMRLERPFADV